MKRLLLLLVAPLLLALLPGPTPAAAAADDEQLRVTGITPWLVAGRPLEVHVASPPEDAVIVASLYGRVRSRSEFAATGQGRLLGGPQRQLSFPVRDLPLDFFGDRFLSIPSEALPPLRDGVYPLRLTLQRGTAPLDRQMSYVVRLPDGPVDVPLAVAAVVPLGMPARAGGDPTPADRAALVGAIGALDTAAGMPLTLDPAPQALTGLQPDDLAPLRRAVASGDQLLASPWVDVEPSALVAAGRAGDLAAQRQAGEDALLAATGDRGDPRTWSVEGPLTVTAGTRLRELGVTRVVLSEASLEPLTSAATRGLTLTRPFLVGGAGNEEPFEATAAEPGLAGHFRNDGNPVLAAQSLLADLAVLFFDAPGTSRGVTVRPPATWRANATMLRTTLSAVAAAPILRPVTVDRLLDDVPILGGTKPTMRKLLASARPTVLPVKSITAAASAVQALADLTGPAGPPVASARQNLLLSEAVGLTSGGRRAVLAQVTGALDGVRGRIGVPNARTFRLTAREGTIPITITNDNPFPVHVDLELSSEKLEFTDVRDGDRSRLVLRDLTVDPGRLTRTVPVRARASAAFSLRARLLSTEGAELTRTRYTVISTAFSGVGIALSIAAGAFLLLWWASHWRTARRGRHLVDPPQ